MKHFFILLCSLFLLVGCKNSDDEPVHLYAGTWSGVFVGANDNGSWNLTVTNGGAVTGTFTSDVTKENLNIYGTVTNEGVLTTTLGATVKGGNFNGTLSLNATSSGTWLNIIPTPDQTGTWQGNKD